MNETFQNKKYKRIINIIGNIFVFIIIALALFVLIITINSKKDRDGTATVFGYQLRFVKSDSMGECELTDVSNYEIKSIPVKSCIFIETVPEDIEERNKWLDELAIGDVLTFKYVYNKQETITHRIVDKEKKETGGYIITLEGDNKNSDTNLLSQVIDTSLEDSPNYIVGKVTGKSYILGLFVYAFKSTIGIICLVLIPCLIIIIIEVIKIVRLFSKEEKQKEIEKDKKLVDEIAELKRQLAALQDVNSEENELKE